ncbi:MAG: hypothetical protein KJ549_04630, partial [Alphaproteobacteria bacterium]|nr:hypothetical protein [Alphaproteobacteria bacterium]
EGEDGKNGAAISAIHALDHGRHRTAAESKRCIMRSVSVERLAPHSPDAVWSLIRSNWIGSGSKVFRFLHFPIQQVMPSASKML